MEDPVKEVEQVINNLTTARDSDLQAKTVYEYYTSDAGFDHPLAWVKNGPNSRESVLGVYRAYQWLSDPKKIEINSMSFDEKKNQMTIDLFEHISFWVWPWRNVKLRLVVVLTLKKVGGKFYIYKQEDFFPVQDLLNILPGLGFLVRVGKTTAAAGGIFLGSIVHTLKIPRVFFPSSPSPESVTQNHSKKLKN